MSIHLLYSVATGCLPHLRVQRDTSLLTINFSVNLENGFLKSLPAQCFLFGGVLFVDGFLVFGCCCCHFSLIDWIPEANKPKQFWCWWLSLLSAGCRITFCISTAHSLLKPSMDSSTVHLFVTIISRILAFSNSLCKPLCSLLAEHTFQQHFKAQLFCCKAGRPDPTAANTPLDNLAVMEGSRCCKHSDVWN